MKKLLLVFALFLTTLLAQAQMTATQKVYAAIVKNNPADVEALLAAGADANAPVEMMPGFPTTFLVMAAGNGHLEVVKALLKNKAQVDKTDSFQMTPLMAAAANGSLDVVEFLLANGANPKAKDKEGKDVLAAAKDGENEQIVKLIKGRL